MNKTEYMIVANKVICQLSDIQIHFLSNCTGMKYILVIEEYIYIEMLRIPESRLKFDL